MPRPRRQDVLAALADLKQAMERRFDGIDARFGGVDSRLDGVDGRLDGIDDRLDGIDGRLTRHDAHFERLDRSLFALDQRVEKLDERLTGRIDGLALDMAGGFDRVDARLGRLEDEYQAMRKGLRRLEQERLG